MMLSQDDVIQVTCISVSNPFPGRPDLLAWQFMVETEDVPVEGITIYAGEDEYQLDAVYSMVLPIRDLVGKESP